VTLTNTGTAALTISGISSAGDYAQSNTCGTGVAVGGNCTIQVTFTPTTTGSRSGSVSITDNAAGSPQQITLTGNGTAVLSITTSSLPGGAVGTVYSASLTASGGTPSYSWALVSGSLPAGLTLSAAGLVSGTPSTAGTYTFTVQASDSGSPAQTATKTLSIAVAAVPPPLSINTSSLPNGTMGVNYSATLSANGGTSPYNWSVISGSLPTGLTLAASAAQVSGTPSVAGNYSFTLQVTDSSSPVQTATQAYSVNIAANPPVITTTSLADAVQNSAYTSTLAATGGVPPYSWSLVSGSLPPGLTLSAAGVISGNPNASGPSGFTVGVTDADNQTASQALSITVDAPSAGPPILVQRSSGSNTFSPQLANTPTVYYALLPDGSQAGNTIAVAFQYDNTYSPTPTVTDDQGNAYQIACTETDTTYGRVIGWAYASNVTAGTRAITLFLAASNAVSDIAVHLFEMANVGAVDGCGGNFGVSTSVTASSITPSAAGDIILQAMAKDDADTSSTISAGSQSNITWQLATADLQDHGAMGVQWGVYSSTSALTPTMTTSGASNNSFVSAAIAFKAAAAGSDLPSGQIRIRGILHFSSWSTGHCYSGDCGPGYSNPTTVAAPSYGNLLVMADNGSTNSGTTKVVSAISDNLGNTWTAVPSAVNTEDGSHSNVDEFWYCSPCTTGPNLVLTVIQTDGSSRDHTLNIYDITGAASSAFDTYGGNTGGQWSYASSLSTASVTPSTANGLVFFVYDNGNNTVTGMTSGQLVDSEWYNDESNDGPENVDENNGWGHYYNPNTSPVTGVFTFGLHATDAQGYWAASAAAFKAD